MMNDTTAPAGPRTGPLMVIAAGALLMTGSVLADAIGLSGGGAGFGWKQLIAAIAGLVILLAGTAWFLQPPVGDALGERGHADDSGS